jgi:tRNA dimethylallyltransferase
VTQFGSNPSHPPSGGFARWCWFLTGPTAGRKTEVGVALAQRIGAEIVSMDSMALYRGMDIGTAKPSPRELGAVRHHLIDVLQPHEEFSVAEYLAAASRTASDIRARGREVLFVGGTPLYLKALLRGLFQGPPADWDLRRSLQAEAKRVGPEAFHRRLAEVDPQSARWIHPNDTRRIVRALEVYAKTGLPISAYQQQFKVGVPADACRVFVLDWPKEELNVRIDRRVEQMFAAGLVEETRGLLAGPRPLSKTASQALGYREVIEHLAGKRGLEETIALVKTHTRQFAKRQRTWFRSLSECRFVPISDGVGPTEIADRIREKGTCYFSAK